MKDKNLENKQISIIHSSENQLPKTKLEIKNENEPEYVNIYWDEWKI